jgi:hypothetical protein
MDVPKASLAVADVAPEPEAAVVVLGSIGTRQGAREPRRRTMPSTATPLVCVAEAGPGGAGLSRDRTQHGPRCGVVAPALLPQQAGDRPKTARRAASPGARLRRAGALPPIANPAGAAASAPPPHRRPSTGPSGPA